ncbi:hypothetical protein [Maribacter sp. HTCC2170]|uniref:hypothetical protein n=1 Tax=Maribacter sp. (strain HTCC2170 / KCCM 42371) TaxID=313603 RepID=UPI00006B3B04|nr:hypothetical protein [Maribacter sp. HTCC2170]EAQ99780.1 hypothetical protein FB2170_07489 [Maribacter sp. HTCC2170]
MKNIIGILVFALILANFSSCKEQKKDADNVSNEQMKKVMAIHDEVMPKMSSMGQMVSKLKVKEDSTELGLQYKEARIMLQDANKAMMDWMQGFGGRFDSDEILNGKALTEQKQIWLNEEEEKVKALRKQIYSSIEKAEKLLGNTDEHKTINYLKLKEPVGSGFRMNSGKPMESEKASTVEKLRGCVAIMADPTMVKKEKVLYFQFIGPDNKIIKDIDNPITEKGKEFSKKIELLFMGEDSEICDFISITQGSLKAGNYILNIFEGEKLLESAKFELK